MSAEEIKLWAAIVLTSVAKWLLTDEGPVPDETPRQASTRRRKAFGGIIAGCLTAYYGHAPVIRWIDALTEQDKLIVAIVLALTGEHFMRWCIEAAPNVISKIAGKFFGEKK